MSGATDQFAGGCLCGAVRFVAFEQTAYRVIRGEITKFDSTPGRTRRGFCARRGSTSTCESAGLPTETHFHIGTFDRAPELRPTRHVLPAEQLPWLHLGEIGPVAEAG